MVGRRPKVLVVEDDDALALSIHRALYRGSDRFDTITAKSGEVGREIMREMLVDVLVTDVNLPGLSGLDLVYWAAFESPETHFVVVSGEDVTRFRDRICAVGCLRVLAKPFDPNEILIAVTGALESREQVSGQLAALCPVDLIQMLCLGKRSASVRITANDTIGGMLVKDGVLVHAVWGKHVGEDAVQEIVAIADGVFRTAPLPDTIERTIHRDWGHVVMDAVRRLDEGREEPKSSGTWPTLRADDPDTDELLESIRRSSPPAGTNERRPSDPPLNRAAADPNRAAAALLDKGFAALRSGDLAQARMCWEAAQRLEPDNRSIELNLRKLDSIRARSSVG